MEPRSEDELAAMLRAGDGPLVPRGGDTRAAVAGRARLSTAGLTGITLYEPGALTLVARAGTPMAEIDRALADEGQRLAFEPPSMAAVLGRDGVSTIGGVVATNASGPRRMVAGACRDSLIGVRLVDGTGMIVSNGGRVMKNVTGYDLVKLMAGSRGMLGVLTEVSFKTLPCPETALTLRASGLSPERAVAAMSAALGTPFEVTGAAHDPALGATWLRLEGFEASVAARADRLAAALSGWGAWDRDADAELWPRLRDAADFVGGAGDLWRISVRPSRAAGVAARLPGRWRMDWGGGLIWAETPRGHDLRADLPGLEGHATLVRASPATHDRLGTLHPEPAPVGALTAGLKSRFDPRGLFRAAA
ncbi:FAD-binding protein [Palleronia sediminis]|uniref:FAD-binding protein n=1 Tax=Palleronia sediminis TaxID=2547833 RepID=UPI00197D1272|nr:FAD-binding protein [Palleronia sediminis]